MPAQIDPNIALSATQPNALPAMQGWMNLGALGQSIQGQRIANTANQANLDEIQNARQVLNDPNAHNPDGTLTQDAQNRLVTVAPTVGPGIAAGQANAQTAVQQTGSATTANKYAHFQLEQGQSKAGLDSLNAMFGDPRIMGTTDPKTGILTPASTRDASTAISEQEDRMITAGVPKTTARMLSAPFYLAAGHNPEALPQLVQNSLKAAQGASGTVAANTPNLVDTGSGMVNVNPMAPGATPMAGGAVIPKTLAPGQQQQVTTDPVTGNQIATVRDSLGNLIGQTAIPRGGSLPAPMRPGDAELIPQLTTDRQAMNKTALAAKNTEANYGQVMALSKDAITGPLASRLQQLLGASGPEFQDLQHVLALQAQNNASTMGVHTDAGQVLTSASSGSVEQKREAIQYAAQTNMALARGVQYFNRGAEMAIAQHGGDVRALQDFRTAWTNAYDQNALNYMVAKQAGNDQLANQAVAAAGGADALSAKLKAMQMLSTQGHP
jgi:hypothetical protein